MEHAFLWSLVLVALSSLPDIHGLSAIEKTNLTRDSQVAIEDSSESGYYNMISDGLPNHATADFPTNYNPNKIEAQSYKYTIPKSPTVASESSCLPMGPIGLTLSGVAVYNPYTADINNAVEGDNAEEFDQCDGHPSPGGSYHYHKIPTCISASSQPGQVVGVALDGFPIYSNIDADGSKISHADLDDCNGRTVNGQYRYHMTEDFPYIIGCFMGELHSSSTSRGPCQKAIEGGEDGNGSSALMPILSSALLIIMAGIILN